MPGRRSKTSGKKVEARRFFAAFLFLSLCFLGAFFRVFSLQIIHADSMREISGRQGRLDVELLPWRGTIYDSKMRELAISVSTDSLYLRPSQLRNPDKVLPGLAEALEITEEELDEKIKSESPFVWLKRKVEKHKTAAIKTFPGLGKIEESSRFYPGEMLASHVIGFAGMDNYGLEGIELVYDKYLSGIPGALNSRRDARGRETAALRQSRVEPDEGHSLVLTIDKLIQFIVEDEIDRAFTVQEDDAQGRIKVEGLSVIVMHPGTGRILALANRPSFSPVNAGSFPAGNRRNRALTDVFEPGSSFKVVAAAAALEEGVFTPGDRIDCENGAYRIAGHTIRDVSPSDYLTFSQVIEKSSNVGMVKVGKKLGNQKLYEYVRKFGFGEKSGCDLPGEAAGLLRHPRSWSGLSNASISFGYEVGVNALQMASAYSAIANGGLLMKPAAVDSVIDKKGNVVAEFSPVSRRRVVSAETSTLLTNILVKAVNDGTGARAKIPGYSIAGKTGTARKLGADGQYSRTDYVSSFAGFAPANRPEIVVVVVIDQPDVSPGRAYGGSMAAPLFRSITLRTLRYLGISPEDSPAETARAPSEAFPPGGLNPAVNLNGRSNENITAHANYMLYKSSGENFKVVMPDVAGLSMRDVLRLLSPYGLDLKFAGSGRAARQSITPGDEIAPGQKCLVTFSAR